MKISPYTIYLEMQPNALLVRQNFIICKKWVLLLGGPLSPILGMSEGQNNGLDPMMRGTLRLLRGGGAEDAFQPLIHLAHPVG
jgi:hypothetical protein